jgi:hypothetical protein
MGTGSKPNKLGNLNNITHEASKHFANKKRDYLKGKINELEIHSKNKNMRDLYKGINLIWVTSLQHI